jgi:hypothetical protein
LKLLIGGDKLAIIPGQRTEGDPLFSAHPASSITLTDITKLASLSNTNSGDETQATILAKLGASSLTGTNTGDETQASILAKLEIGAWSATGTNTGDETQASILAKLGIESISGLNTGDETEASILSKLGVSSVVAEEADPVFLVHPAYSITLTDIATLAAIPAMTGTNTGDETQESILALLGVSTLSGTNTGDETATSIKEKLGVTSLSGANSGDQISTSVPYTAGLSGAAVRDVGLKLDEHASVKDLGATGDGIIDDTTAVTNAVALMYALGAPLYWPEGTYLTTATIPYFHSVRHWGPGIVKRGSDLWYITPTTTGNKIYVNASTGDDDNDGLTSSQPLLTGQTGADVIAKYAPLMGAWYLNLAGVFSAGISLANRLNGDSNYLYICGADVHTTGGIIAPPTTKLTNPTTGLIGLNINVGNKVKVVDIEFNDWQLSAVNSNPHSTLWTSNVHAIGCLQGIVCNGGKLYVTGGRICGTDADWTDDDVPAVYKYGTETAMATTGIVTYVGTVATLGYGSSELPVRFRPPAISGNGSTVTVTMYDHGLSTNDVINAAGCNISAYNATGVSVTKVSADSFTYPAAGTGTPATFPLIYKVSQTCGPLIECLQRGYEGKSSTHAVSSYCLFRSNYLGTFIYSNGRFDERNNDYRKNYYVHKICHSVLSQALARGTEYHHGDTFAPQPNANGCGNFETFKFVQFSHEDATFHYEAIGGLDICRSNTRVTHTGPTSATLAKTLCTIPAGYMSPSINGRYLEIHLKGQVAGSADAKTIGVRIGTTTICSMTLTAGSRYWWATIEFWAPDPTSAAPTTQHMNIACSALVTPLAYSADFTIDMLSEDRDLTVYMTTPGSGDTSTLYESRVIAWG